MKRFWLVPVGGHEAYRCCASSSNLCRIALTVAVLATSFLHSQVYAIAPVSADNPLQFKQLAGPPSEFGAMARPDPARSAMRSKSALLPITLKTDPSGRGIWSGEIPIEREKLRFAVFSGRSSTQMPWKVLLHDPVTGRAQSPEAQGGRRREAEFNMSDNHVPADVYEFTNQTPGIQQISIESNEPGQGFILIEGDGPARLVSYQAALNQRVGQHIGLIAHLSDAANPMSALASGTVTAASLRLTAPDGRVSTIPMFDDGLHQDDASHDGVYRGDFLADRAGNFNVQVVFRARDTAGRTVVRTAEHLIPVVEDIMTIQQQVVASSIVSARRLQIRLNVSAPPTSGHYRIYAEVWGSTIRDADVPTIPVAWIGGMTDLHDGGLTLGLDARWIALAGAHAPFELRNVRVEDPNYCITLATSERIRLSTPQLPTSTVAPSTIAIDDEMRLGPHPAVADNGYKLLLVHGYCSSDVWGPVAGQFTNAAVFYDLGATRTIDDFAQRIGQWGYANGWSSYAIVAHSQGGMAALHLYTYYWSGLDCAGPGRLIQSVGTPYQGTPLAGLAAVLGQLFGEGCGSNPDLTYEGAAAWLVGIPTPARAAVNYYTTSFTDNFGDYDYCSRVTDLLLTDPDDGVVEKAWGQLSGGVNQGHTTGQCHSADMRDPPQTRDATRNAAMNASAPTSGSACVGIGTQVLYYTFDDPSNRYRDDSGHNHTGAIAPVGGATLLPGVVATSGGVWGKSLNFTVAPGNTGVEEYSTADAADLDIPGAMTGIAWIRPHGRNDIDPGNCVEGTIFSKGGANWFQVNNNNDGLLFQNYYGTGARVAFPAGALAANTWHQVAFTRKSVPGGVTLFLDGAPVGAVFLSDAVPDNAAPLSVGNFGYDGPWECEFNGDIDELQIFNGSKGSAFIASEYHRIRDALALNVSTIGSGGVTKNPQRTLYAPGTAVTLTASAFAQWYFAGWAGEATGTTNPLPVTMNANKSIIAQFQFIDIPAGPVGQACGRAEPLRIAAEELDVSAIRYVFALSANRPNPFRDGTAIAFVLPGRSPVAATVFDLNGRLVADLSQGVMDAGPHELVWNGRNQSGAKVGSGVYLFRLAAGGASAIARMVVLR